MANYLGESVVDIKSDPIYKNYTEKDWAMYFIESYGQIDGAHHKLWVLDQVARILNGTPIILKKAKWDNETEEYRVSLEEPSSKYVQWVKDFRGEVNEDGEYEYGYDEGCPP